MRRRTASLFLVLFGFLAPVGLLHGAQKSYSTGKFVDVQQKTREKVDMYLVNTPVTTAVLYFEVSVELDGIDYLAEYTPRHSGEELPEAWKAGENVQGRLEKHHLFLKRPDGSETQFIINKRSPVEKTHE
jgi:hypothetical protein